MTGNLLEFELQRLLSEEPFVRRLARGLLFDEHRVDDVVQQTWIAALRNPPRGAADGPAGLRGWIGGVVRRLAANEVRGEVRRRRREATVESVTPVASADQLLEREELRHQVVEALQSLGEPYRTAVALRYLEGLEPTAIAIRLGVPAATVRTRVRRGLQQMRERLDRRHGGDRDAWCSALVTMIHAAPAAARGTAGAWAARQLIWAALAAALLMLGMWTWSPESALMTPPTSPRVAAADSGADSAASPATAADERRVVHASSPVAAPIVGGSMRGRLLGLGRQPLGAVQLEAFAFDGSRLFGGSVELPSVETRTAADGSFVFNGLPPHASVFMLADVDGAQQQLVPLAHTPAPDRVVDLGDVVLEPRGALTGTVVDEDGEPVAGAEVWSADLPSLVLAAMPVDRLRIDNGVLLMVPRPNAAQCADTGAWQDAARDHLAFRVVTTDYGVQPESAWLPVVVDTERFASMWRRLPFARAKCDAAGRFALRGVAFGNNVVVASKRGMATAVRQRVAVRDTAPRDVGALELTAGETAEGIVVDATGAPVKGAEVRIVPLSPLGFRGVAPCEPAVRTDVEGRFVVPGLPGGQVMVVWRGSIGEPWRLVGPVEGGDELTLSVPRPVPVTMRFVLPDGYDPSAVRVFARPTPPLGELSRLGMAGEFHMVALLPGERTPLQTTFLSPGIYTLRAELPGLAPIVRLVDVAAVTDPLHLVFAKAPEVTIVVHDARGAPVRDAEVFVQSDGDPDARSVMASRYGMQTFDDPWPLPPLRSDAEGRVVLRAAPGPMRVSARHGRDGAASHALEVLADVRVTLQLGGTGAIVGRAGVAPNDGGKPGDYRVTARLHWQEPDVSPIVDEAGARPDADGRFRFDGLVPGRYTVRWLDPLPPSLTFSTMIAALRDRIGWGIASVREAQVEVVADGVVDVQFAEGGQVGAFGAVRGVVRVAGAPAAGCTVWLREAEHLADGSFSDAGWERRARATIGPDGGFVVGDLPLTTCWLGVRDSDHGEFLHVFEVEVSAGSPVPVRADIELGRLQGRVMAHDGVPLTVGRVLLHRVESGKVLEGRATDVGADGRFAFDRLPLGEWELRVRARHDRCQGPRVAVLRGDATPPVELTCRAVHHVRVRLADDVIVPEGSMTLFGLRPVGQEVFSSHAGPSREHEFTLDEPGHYEVILRIGGVWTTASPKPIQVLHLDEFVEVRPGEPHEHR